MKTKINNLNWKSVTLAVAVSLLTSTVASVAAPSPTPTAAPVTVTLPTDNFDNAVPLSTVKIEAVATTNIPSSLNYIAFQGDLTFDSAVVSFASPAVQAAGRTLDSFWSFQTVILNTGPGTIKTLRLAGQSGSATPLAGSGTLFELRMLRVSSTPGATSPLVWGAPPLDFVFIDSDPSPHPPIQPPGLITITGTGPSPTPTPPPPTPTPTATPTPTPTPAPVSISGNIAYCASSGPVPNVTLTLSGGPSGGSAQSNLSGYYQFTDLIDGNYTVTPAKAALTPGSGNIDTIDTLAAQRHFLVIGTPLSGCRLTAADVNGVSGINTIDAVAIQRFFLGFTSGIANVGKYKFDPLNRMCAVVAGTPVTGQDFSNTLVFGDVAPTFAHRPDGPSQTAADDDISAREVTTPVATLSLPNVAVDASITSFIVPVTATAIDAKNKLVGFQGNFTFDERVVAFQSEPVQKAGLTGGNWNVSGNVLTGPGPIRTLRISAFSNEFTALSGSGTLFELRMTRVSKAALSTQMIWAAPPDHFIFIDADLRTQKPDYAASGGVSSSEGRK